MDKEYFSVRQVASRYGVDPATIWRWSKDSDFPQPIRFSEQLVRWDIEDLLRWENAKRKASGAPGKKVSRPKFSPVAPPAA